ncbi:MAG: hypothetical protein RLZZ316_2164 [Bacteroidota bacterium]|jgi:hypothetical protein
MRYRKKQLIILEYKLCILSIGVNMSPDSIAQTYLGFATSNLA